MARKQKPEPDLVKKAARALSDPKRASLKTIRRLAAVILDDQEFNPQIHKPKSRNG
jgi:hypothetical protein